MMQVMRSAAAVTLASALTLACSQQGAANQPALSAPSPTAAATTVEYVLIVDQARLDEIRREYDVSESLGDVSATAACASGSASDDCTRAAQQQLRETAVARGANLVVIVSSALAQSYPPRLTLRGTLHRATPR